MSVILALLWVLLNRTKFGHHAQAIGSNPTAASLSGVRVARITVATFAIGAACAAIGGILLSSRLGSGQVTAGDGFLLSAFAATFLGAAVLRDGEFHIFGTLIGVLIVTVGFNGISIIGAASDKQLYFQGGILIVATALSTAGRRLVAGARIRPRPEPADDEDSAESERSARSGALA
jgi:ribose transport system permease protein